MTIKCKCGYEWTTKSTMDYVSCPNCLRKTENKKEVNENENNSERSNSPGDVGECEGGDHTVPSDWK